MTRQRLTERFPWLLPLRRRQKKLFFYLRMRFDGSRYARRQTDRPMDCVLFSSACPMRNMETGFDIRYQENKIFNLKLAAARLDGLVIAPGESFSFWNRVHGADRKTPYRDALAEVNGKLVTEYGGGLCQLSNLLCWLFLHTPLTVTERHGHTIKEFPEPPSDAPLGVDATVAEGWLDLRARNDTDLWLRLSLRFTEDRVVGTVEAHRDPARRWQTVNRGLRYLRSGGAIYEEVDVVRRTLAEDGFCLGELFQWRNRCRITYPLPEGTEIEEEGESR
jgi:vancomycin resistance protein VanW